MPYDRPRGEQSEEALPEGLGSSDFHLIEDAVLETPRGRWFLREYARRIRAAETQDILRVLARLEQTVEERLSPAVAVDGDAACIAPGCDSVPLPAQALTNAEELMAIQEKLLDMVWYMRERGFDGRLCAAISAEANKLARFAAAGDMVGTVEGDHAEHPVPALPDRAERFSVSTDTGSCGAASVAAPQPSVHAMAGDDVSADADRDGLTAVPPAVAVADKGHMPSKAAALAQKAAAFAAIDALPLRERLGLFS